MVGVAIDPKLEASLLRNQAGNAPCLPHLFLAIALLDIPTETIRILCALEIELDLEELPVSLGDSEAGNNFGTLRVRPCLHPLNEILYLFLIPGEIRELQGR